MPNRKITSGSTLDVKLYAQKSHSEFIGRTKPQYVHIYTGNNKNVKIEKRTGVPEEITIKVGSVKICITDLPF